MSARELQGLALVTGGAGGIGATTCVALTRASATVVVTDQSGDCARAVAGSLGPRAEAVALDVSDASACADLVEDLCPRHGGIDHLAHVAGLAGVPDETADATPRPLLELGNAEWDPVLDVHLTGVSNVVSPGVRVNVAAPGVIETPMTRAGLREGAFSDPPIDRVGQPNEVADTILYLLKRHAANVTAKTFHVDGGLLTG